MTAHLVPPQKISTLHTCTMAKSGIQCYARPRSGNLPAFFRGEAGVLQHTKQATKTPALGRGGVDGDVRHTLSYV